ncbi:transposase [Oligoflexus tunisiensis]|uniref:transposase n=1 Tax=Oligoflexus tunisiensis TaxID=708132 RepID=UPI00114D24D5|nr:transposase [Oligoflexus tunisiensis]
MKTDFQRWTARRKVELIVRIMKGEKSLVDVCREQDLKQSEVEGWIETFLKGGENSLKTNAKEDQAQYEREIKDLRATVGELVLELDARKKWQALSQDQETNS